MCELIQTEGFHLTQESLPLRVMGVLASMSEYRVLLLLFRVQQCGKWQLSRFISCNTMMMCYPETIGAVVPCSAIGNKLQPTASPLNEFSALQEGEETNEMDALKCHSFKIKRDL